MPELMEISSHDSRKDSLMCILSSLSPSPSCFVSHSLLPLSPLPTPPIIHFDWTLEDLQYLPFEEGLAWSVMFICQHSGITFIY